MRNKMMVSVVVVCLFAASAVAWAQEGPVTRQECMAQVAKVVDRIEAEGFDAVVPAIKPGLKNMYFLKVPDKNIVLCCGYWEDA